MIRMRRTGPEMVHPVQENAAWYQHEEVGYTATDEQRDRRVVRGQFPYLKEQYRTEEGHLRAVQGGL